jgi:hypothetical protein
MRRILACVGLLALGACGTSQSARQAAHAHQARADELASQHDYDAAAREQDKVDALQRKAAERAADELRTDPPLDPGQSYLPVPLEPTVP